MMYSVKTRSRRGAVLPLVTICLVGLMGFVALAIDIGMMAVARTQCQAAADIAALSGARTLDGKSLNNNMTAAIAMAQSAATSNSILGSAITIAQVTATQVGIYRYDPTAGRFQAVFGQSPAIDEAYGVMQVTISTQQPTFFGGVLGVSSINVGATSTAVHRPRDIAIVLDFSGSMGYSSQFSYTNSSTQSLSPDDRFPRFGPWSVYNGAGMVMDFSIPGTAPGNLNTYTPPTPMQRVWAYVDTTGYLYAPNNLTTDTPGGPAIVGQFTLADNSTQAFVNSGTFPSFTNVNVSTSGNATYVVTPAPSTFSNQSASGFVGDPFPLRSGQSITGTTAPTASQFAHTVQGYLTGSNTGATNTTINTTFEANGYDWDFTANALKSTSQRFQGFTMGPGYYGKTFYYWPPDPRTPANNIGDTGYVAGDWRRRFFLPRTGSTQDSRDNSMFWGVNGRWKTQNTGASANYIVNYDNILKWLTRGPQTLPASLRCGRVVYYDAIPTTIPIDQSTGMCTAAATNDQRFWKDYIDYVLGAGRWTDSNVLSGANTANSNSGGGSTVYYNTANSNLSPQITPRATLVAAATTHPVTGATNASPIVISSNNHGLVTGNVITLMGVAGNTAANGTFTVTNVSANSFSLNGSTGNGNYLAGGTWTIIPYMHYGDSPVHPRTQFWFGPLSMLGYLQAPGNWLPGNCYESQCWQLKAGIYSAINDIKNNHPNDLASVIFFSGSNGYSTARVGMSKDYTDMQNCLYYPYSLLGSLGNVAASIHPFSTTTPTTGNPAGLNDTSDTEIPNAGTYTCPQMGFEVAYNQFSNATDSPTSTTFTGRKTATKVVIYETDGVPNTICSGSITSSGGYHYTGIGGANYVTTSATLHVTPKDNARAVVRQIVASTTASPPGYSSARNPARVHCIAFGDLFESYSTSAMKAGALRFVCAVQIDGNTSPTPPGSWDNDTLDYNAYYLNLEPYKLITGDYNTRVDKIRQALERIMQGGVQVALIQ
jgi:hypothetical protein